MKDIRGLAISTSSAEASAAMDLAVASFLNFRLDAREHLSRGLAADPEFGLAHCLKGYFAMLLYKQASVAQAAESARTARPLVAKATPRERAHVEALEAWAAGDLDRTLATWEAILADHPTDVLAVRLAHYKFFWLGRRRDMVASVERVLPQWDHDLTGWGAILSCRCFAHEECGDYATAEAAGRAAVELDPADLWATHAVAHVMEMQDRHDEGIAWLSELERHWAGANNLLHHLWWHRALFHLERREFDEVLALYDRRFRDLNSPLAQAQPDFHIEVQNAASCSFGWSAMRFPSVIAGCRQGRKAHRGLPVAVHPAALADGAGRDRPVRRGAAHARRDARVQPRQRHHCPGRRRCCGADRRGRAGASAERQVFARRRADAAGAR